MPVAPTLTQDQRRLAYERSLELRRERAELKQFLSGGRTDGRFYYVWQQPPAQGMKVFDLLTALPGIGEAKARKILAEAKIPEKNTVRACGPKQRERLFALLG